MDVGVCTKHDFKLNLIENVVLGGMQMTIGDWELSGTKTFLSSKTFSGLLTNFRDV